MNLSPVIEIGREIISVLSLEPGPHGDICANVASLPESIAGKLTERVLILRQGPNREPVRLVELPTGLQLRLRTIY